MPDLETSNPPAFALTQNDDARGERARAAELALSNWTSRTALLLLLAFTYFLYSPATRFGFVYDDIFQILSNDHLNSWRFLPVYFTQHVWSHVPQIPANFYRPLFLLWLRLNTVAFGHEPTGWHFTNILLHLAVTGLAYVLGLRLFKQRSAALAAAAIFGVHPVHVESVAWVSGAPEPLSAVLFLGSLLCYLHAKTVLAKARWQATSLALFACALLAKETAAVLPGVILAYELTLGRSAEQDRRRYYQRTFQALVSYITVLAAYLAVRSLVLSELTHRMTDVPLRASLLTWPWLLCVYIRELFWPSGLSPLYDVSFVQRLTQPGFVLPVLALLGVGLVLYGARRKIASGLPAFLSLWFLLTIAPAMLAFCVALPAEAYHDRYLYLPSLAFALMVGSIFGWSIAHSGPARRAAAILPLVAVAGALAKVTYRQLPFWQTNYDLFQRAADVAPRNEIANLNFAGELIKRQEYARALQACQRDLAYNPNSARVKASAGTAAFFLKNYQQAARYFEDAAQTGPPQAYWYQMLGLSRLNLGQYGSARDALQLAAITDPETRGVHFTLGLVEKRQGRWSQARDDFAAELALDGSNQAVRSALNDAEAHLRAAPETASIQRNNPGLLPSRFPEKERNRQKLSK